MASILEAVLPLFALIVLGFAAGKARMLDESGVRALAAFVFNFAMPPLLFRLMARTTLDDIAEPGFAIGYLYAEALMFVGGAIVAGLVFRRGFSEMAIQGFGGTFSNGVLLGLPLLLSVFGERGAVPALIVIVLDIVLFAVVTILLEVARTDDGRARAGAGRRVGRSVVAVIRNPILSSTVLGLLWGATGIELPVALDRTLEFAGQAGPPAALFALGASLAMRRIAGNLGPAGAMVVFKLALHPTAFFLIGTTVVPLDPFLLAAGMVFAACPVGANVYIFAETYKAGVATASTAILASTLLSMATITGLLLWIGPV